jgi:hypothetical protein
VNPAVFTTALVIGAAALALWTDTRYPSLAPSSTTARFAHAGIAALLLVLMPAPDQPGTFQVYALLALLLALIGYSFLTGIWLLRVLQGTVLRS